MTAVVCVTAAPFTALEPIAVVGITFGLLGVLQLGYLAGLMVSCAWSRAGRPVIADSQLTSEHKGGRALEDAVRTQPGRSGDGIQSLSLALRTAATALASKARSSQTDQWRT